MSNLILGGGISGLSTAFYLSKAVKNGIKIYESSQRLGGWIKTIRKPNGTLFEHGPRTIKCQGIAAENTLQLVKEIGLMSSIKPVSRTSDAAKNRMIYFNNQLITLPTSLGALFKIDPPFIKPFIFAILNDLRAPKKCVPDESIYDFVARRFGESYADILVSATICGIFAGDAKEISVKALLGNLFQKEQECGSVIKGFIYSQMGNIFGKEQESKSITNLPETKQWSVWSLENGLETLPSHMSSYLEKQTNVEIYLDKKCTKVEFKNGKALLTFNESVETADHLYSSLPSKDLAHILGDEHSVLRKELSAIPFVNVGIVNFEFEGDLLEKKGFGFLVPPNQNLPILGVIFDSCIFPQEGKTVLTVMMGGKWFHHYFGSNPDESLLLKIAQDQVRTILKIDKVPTCCMATVLRDCIPQYVVGHSERLQRIRQYIQDHKLPLTIIGNSFDGVGINDAILSAKKGVEQKLKNVQL